MKKTRKKINNNVKLSNKLKSKRNYGKKKEQITKCKRKVLVFDFDETLGYFVEFGILWDVMLEFIKKNKLEYKEKLETTKKSKIITSEDSVGDSLKENSQKKDLKEKKSTNTCNTMSLACDKKTEENEQKLFDDLLDLYPEFLRPNIIEMLTYLKIIKKTNRCYGIYVYTNNQAPPLWVKRIIQYMHKQVKCKIIEQIVGAYKIGNEKVELCRTTHDKTYNDFLSCTKLDEDTHVCFVDDIYHPEMKNEKVHYINIKPYTHDLDFDVMITRLIESNILHKIFKNFKMDNKEIYKELMDNMNKFSHNFTPNNYIKTLSDKENTSVLIQNLKEYFSQNKDKIKGGKVVKI